MPMDAGAINSKGQSVRDRFLNRELSGLAFIRRVLEEAENDRHPLLERLHFLVITEMLLDEFYRIRVAALRARIRSGDTKISFDGLPPDQELHMADRASNDLLALQGRSWESLHEELAGHGVRLVEPEELSESELVKIEDYFRSRVLPALKPQVITPATLFPFLADGETFLGVSLENRAKKKAVGIVSLPPKLPRFHKLMGHDNRFPKDHRQLQIR